MGSETSPGARELILDAAVRVLRESGPSKLSQTRVAKEAGLRQGHLTYYFPRKKDLWVAAAEHAETVLEQELGEFLSSDGWPGADATEKARVLALVTYLVKDRERTKLAISLALQSTEDPDLHKIFLASQEKTRRMVSATFKEQLAPEIVDLALSAFWGLGMHHMLYADRPEGQMIERMVTALFDLFQAHYESNASSAIH